MSYYYRERCTELTLDSSGAYWQHATEDVIDSKRGYVLKWCEPNNDNDYYYQCTHMVQCHMYNMSQRTSCAMCLGTTIT